jgi:hypothetical protein
VIKGYLQAHDGSDADALAHLIEGALQTLKQARERTSSFEGVSEVVERRRP